jgi:hypothetical protein
MTMEFKGQLIIAGLNAKTTKGDGSEYVTAIQYMAPAETVDGLNVCPMAKLAGCEAACLYTAGRGQMNSVQAARIRKSEFWRDDREGFLDTLRNDLRKFSNKCAKAGVQPCVRLNGTSDIRWERTGIMEEFPGVQFYDYTKDLARVARKQPANYHLTLSYSEASPEYRLRLIAAMGQAPLANVAVVFRSADVIPETFLGRRVVDGDKDDLRFLDPQGVVVALYAKGAAKKDTSGFVIG